MKLTSSRHWAVAALAGAALLATSPGRAEDQTKAQAEFLRQVHSINLAEIDVGSLAETRALTPAMRDFGKTLAQDHAAADDKVTAVAKAHGVELGAKVEDEGTQDLQAQLNGMAADLQKAPASAFDAEFARHMAKGHEDAIKLVETAQLRMKGSADLETLASGLLPTLKQHQAIAQSFLDRGIAH
jgi:putative membrane protein